MRTKLAQAYIASRRRRIAVAGQALTNVDAVNITALCPTRASMPGHSPTFDALLQINPEVITSNLVGLTVVPAGTVPTTIGYPMTFEEETDGIRARGLFAKDNTRDVLLTPLPDSTTPSGFVENELWLVSMDAQLGTVTFPIVFEVADLAWKGGRDGSGQDLSVEYEAAPRARINYAENLALDESGGAAPSVNLASIWPTKAQIGDAPFVDFLATFTIADVTAGPRVGFVTNAGDIAASRAAYDKLSIDEGRATIRVRKTLPREAAASTTLEDLTIPFIFNDDAANAYTLTRFFEVPSLDWV